MNRVACMVIKGFYYQFLHATYLCTEILIEGNGTKLICEGTEDIDKIQKEGKTYIQVKTTSKTINLASKAFKKSVLNFYREYKNDKNIIFVLHTNAKPGTEMIDGQRTNILKLWISNQNSGWDDPSKINPILIPTQKVITDYASREGINDLNFDEFDENFIKQIYLEFNNPEEQAYEQLIKEKLGQKFPKAEEEYLNLIFINLIHLVIKKSISKDIKDRYIDYNLLNELITKTKEDLIKAYQDILLTDEENKLSIGLDTAILKLDKIFENTEKIIDNTGILVNQGLIEQVELPKKKEEVYSTYPFVHKLIEAKIPPKIVFNAKNHFYQSEYAIKVEEVDESELKTKELNRLKSAIKNIYSLEYEEAKATNISSIILLINTNKQILSHHNNVLATVLRFDFFHKLGLLHHVSNEDEEVKWVIKDE